MGDTWGKNRGNLDMRINKEASVGLVIDIQERLFPHMDQKEVLLDKSIVLLEGLKILKVPILLTEQYPRGLGQTIEQIRLALDNFAPVEKIAFSCCDESAYLVELSRAARRNVIICGIEAHVCVLQTVIDLLGMEYQPVVVSDCVSSRSPEDKKVALERMRTEGAIITTCESILFELARVAGTDEFKAISRLVK